MTDYFKFWLAKELVPLAFIAAIALFIGGLLGVAWIADKLQRITRKWRG